MSEILNIWNSAPRGSELTKAMLDDMQKKQQVEPKSAIIDPLNANNIAGVRGKPSSIPYHTLRRMAQIPAVSAIIKTRLNQASRFTKRPRFNGDLGFRIGLKDKQRKMTEAERKRAFEIEEFFLKTGWEKNRVRKDNFNQFTRKILLDSLTLDAMTFEKVPNMKGGIAEMWAVDASTIELVVNNPMGELDWEVPVYQPETRRGLDHIGQIAYVQKVQGQVRAEYPEEELAYGIRNPQTDVLVTDFGRSELEDLIEIVTGIVNGVRYNTTYFSHSHLPQGVLEIVGQYKDKHLEGFKRHWKNLTSGADGKWQVPIMALQEGQGFKFTPFKNSNRDMEFNEFLEFLFNISCAVYQIDPNEVGFKSWTSQSGGMTQSDNTGVKIDESKDKGFVPLMNFVSDTFNSEIVDEIDDKYVFEWVGVNEEDEDKKMERQKSRIEMGTATPNMIRTENDEDEIDEPWANAPANPQLIQVYMASMQSEQQAQMGEVEQGQMQADQEQQKEQVEDQHGKQLEVMDKQHEQEIEKKKIDHDHNKELEEMKQKHSSEMAEKVAKQKATEDKKKPNDKMKKSLNSSEEGVDVEIEWTDY